MGKVAKSRLTGKKVRARRHVGDDEGSAERAAWLRGKDAGERGEAPFPPPWFDWNQSHAWLAGLRFAAQSMSGKRPIDTIRRKGAQEAGRP